MSELMVDVAYKTDVGQRREHNEDFVGLYEPTDPAELMASGRLYIVADGVGGGAKGEVASAYAVDKVLHMYYGMSLPDLGERLRSAIQAANLDIYRYSEDHQEVGRMGTTLVAAVIHHDTLTIANVGDSRAYLVRGGEINQITRDHSLVAQMVEAGIITAEEAEDHPQRNFVLRSVGADAKVESDIFIGQLRPGDRVVLCSDGLTRYVPDPEIITITARGSARQAVKELVQLANARGGSDNITVLILHVTASTTPEALVASLHPARPPVAPSFEALIRASEAQEKAPVPPVKPEKKTRFVVPLVIGLAAVVVIAVLFGLGVLASRFLPLAQRQADENATPPSTGTVSVAERVQVTPASEEPAPSPEATTRPKATAAAATATLIPTSAPTTAMSGPVCPDVYNVAVGAGLLQVYEDYEGELDPWCVLWSNGMLDEVIRSRTLRICELCRDPGRIILAREVEAGRLQIHMIDYTESPGVGFVTAPDAYQPDPVGDATYAALVGGCYRGDASKVVFSEAGDNGPMLWTAAADGSDRAPLGDPQVQGLQPALSPTAARVAFVREAPEGFDVFVVEIDGQGEQRVAAGEQPAWSPDGRWLAFVGQAEGEPGGTSILTVELGTDGTVSEPAHVTGGGGYRQQPVWSPDSAWLAFVQVAEHQEPGAPAFGGLWVVSAGGEVAPTNLVQTGASSPVWSPDGGFIAYSRDRNGDGILQTGEAVDLWVVGVEEDADPGVILAGEGRDWLLAWQP